MIWKPFWPQNQYSMFIFFVLIYSQSYKIFCLESFLMAEKKNYPSGLFCLTFYQFKAIKPFSKWVYISRDSKSCLLLSSIPSITLWNRGIGHWCGSLFKQLQGKLLFKPLYLIITQQASNIITMLNHCLINHKWLKK